MNDERFKRIRAKLKPANREAVEHYLRQFYEFMKWPEFSHVIYTQSPQMFAYRNDYNRSQYHYWSRRGNTTWTHSRVNALASRMGPTKDDNPLYVRIQQSQYGNTGYVVCGRRFSEPGAGKIWYPLVEEILELVPKKSIPVVLEKPLEVHINDNEQLHNPEGPAILWRDGTRDYYFNGVRVTQRFIEQEPTLDYIRRQRNQERRRVLIERYGEEKFLKDVRATLRSKDKYGKLWVIPSNGARWNREDEVFVEVTNSTPEPDGSYRKFFIRVPPTTQTPRQAISWSFKMPGAKGGKYRPKVQT